MKERIKDRLKNNIESEILYISLCIHLYVKVWFFHKNDVFYI